MPDSERSQAASAGPPAAREALLRLLNDYDRESRLRIDAVYAQFSPTLDDFYAEELRLEFPRPGNSAPPAAPAAPGRPAGEVAGDATGTVQPEIILTRTVPGQAPKSVRAPGAPFPLGEARRLVAETLQPPAAGSISPSSRASTARALTSGATVLIVRQAGRSQAVELILEPGGTPVLDVLGLSGSAGSAGSGQQ